jgi:hypothetical protein
MRGNITRRGKTSWRIKIDIGRDANGNRRTRYETVRGKRADAERKLTELLKSVDDGTLIDASNISVAEFLNRWERDWAVDNLSPKTAERFCELIRLHIRPRIGALKLQELKPADLVEFYATLSRKGRIRGGGKLSPATVGQIHRILHRALGHAVAWAAVRSNVAAIARPPRKIAEEVQILTAEQVETVLTRTLGLPLHPIIVVALGTGARRGEISGSPLARHRFRCWTSSRRTLARADKARLAIQVAENEIWPPQCRIARLGHR